MGVELRNWRTMLINVTKDIVIDHRVRNFCTLPYEGHPKGCPNFNKCDRCPPKVKTIEEFLDLSQPLYFMVEEFNLAVHAVRMKEKHPEWSEKQARNCYYWQKGVIKYLESACIKFIGSRKNLVYELTPEARGVHVFKTMANLHRPLERKPDIVRKIALIGSRKG